MSRNHHQGQRPAKQGGPTENAQFLQLINDDSFNNYVDFDDDDDGVYDEFKQGGPSENAQFLQLMKQVGRQNAEGLDKSEFFCKTLTVVLFLHYLYLSTDKYKNHSRAIC